MSYTLQRKCSVVLVYDGQAYKFNAMSSYDFSQTYSKKSTARRTLHSRNAKPNTLVTSRNTATFSMSTYPTDTFIESVFFKLIGLSGLPSSQRYYVPESVESTPETCELYVITENREIFKMSPAVLESLDIGLSKAVMTTLNVSFSAGLLEKVEKLTDQVATLVEQTNHIFTPILQFKYAGTELSHVTSAGLALQQDISWRQDQSLHAVGSIYHATKPVLVGSSFTVNVNTYLKEGSETDTAPGLADIEIYKDRILIKIDGAFVTRRIGSGQLLTEAYDISLTEDSKAYVEYGGVTVI